MAKAYSQNWQDVKSVRAQNVWYTNTTSEDLMVVVNAQGRGMTAFIATAESGYSTSIRIAATSPGAVQDFNDRYTWTFIVRPNDQYLMSGPSIGISSWTELVTRSVEIAGPGTQICVSELVLFNDLGPYIATSRKSAGASIYARDNSRSSPLQITYQGKFPSERVKITLVGAGGGGGWAGGGAGGAVILHFGGINTNYDQWSWVASKGSDASANGGISTFTYDGRIISSRIHQFNVFGGWAGNSGETAQGGAGGWAELVTTTPFNPDYPERTMDYIILQGGAGESYGRQLGYYAGGMSLLGGGGGVGQEADYGGGGGSFGIGGAAIMLMEW